MAPALRPRGHWQKMDDDRTNQAMGMARMGVSQNDIARQFGVSQYNISQLMKARGIQPKRIRVDHWAMNKRKDAT